MKRVYLDWNATAPPLPAVIEAITHAAHSAWGNASSVHGEGRDARASLEASRARVAQWLHIEPREVVFTSGGTEANNLALRSLCQGGAQLFTSRLEHPSVVRVAEHLGRQGVHVRWIAVRADGQIEIDDLESALRDGGTSDRVVAVQGVNHETGVLQPVDEAAALCERWGASLHTDVVQAVNKTDGEPWRRSNTAAVAAHKIGGPKGIGALLTRSCTALQPLLLGGAQEGRLRPGTTPVALAAGFGAAADWAVSHPGRYASVRALRDRLEQALVELGGEVNGTALRVPHVVNVSFKSFAADELVAALDMEGISVSGGSACSSGTVERSPVVEAMWGPARASSAVRASLGHATTSDEIDQAIEAWRRVVTRGRADG